ncbi:MAG TPA: aldehyde dehydrogenase family protein [Candidatus Limnocylindria bacterium]|nr:aldehyde dehydrogenase family protein [Candidatus Limnocylindria bacterium]
MTTPVAAREPAANAEPLKVASRIGGSTSERGSGGTFDDVNPARPSELVAMVAACGSDEVEAAVAAAAEAAPNWAAVSPMRRAEILFAAGRLMREQAESIAQLASREMGKPIGEARGEVGAAIAFLEYFGGEATRLGGEVGGSVRDRVSLLTLREPLGVLGLITPWNFPISIPTKKLSAALACGNSAVLKPASRAPAVAARIVELLLEAGVPEGAVNLVTGDGEAVGQALVADRRVAAISFTGSTEVGWRTVAAASARGAGVQAEMGGKNAVVVWDDANLARAVALIVDGAYRSAGQKCTSTSRVIVQRHILPRFTEALVEAATSVQVGDPLAEDTFMGPLVDEAALAKSEHYVERALRDGARLLFGGSRGNPPGFEEGYFFEPTIFADVEPAMAVAQEEIFGPVLAVLACDTFQQALAITNGTPYGLAAVIHTASLELAGEFVRRADVGCAGVNVTSAGWEAHAPFGGTKASGYGIREQGPGAVDFFTRRKTVAALA